MPKSPKLVFFVINLTQSGILQNLVWGRDSQARNLVPNLIIVTFKCGLTVPTSPKMVIFGINLPKRGILHKRFFIKFGLEKGVPGPHLHDKFHRSSLKNVGLQPQKSQTNRNFWYKFVLKGKFRGSTEKVEYRCTTTNLPVCGKMLTIWLFCYSEGNIDVNPVNPTSTSSRYERY